MITHRKRAGAEAPRLAAAFPVNTKPLLLKLSQVGSGLPLAKLAL